jgi:hypothetical protein
MCLENLCEAAFQQPRVQRAFIRDAADALKADRGNSWNPVSLIWSENRYGPFELFARAVCRADPLQRAQIIQHIAEKPPA